MPATNNRDLHGIPGFLRGYNRRVRNRRWDHLYDRQPQPVKEVILERFSEELAGRLGAWPPPDVEWVTDDLRRRWGAGLEGAPRGEVLRLALELARLDLLREHEAFDEGMRNRAPAACQGPADEAALQLLVLYVTEECLSLKDWAEGAKLLRADLAGALDHVERRLFRVTLA
jgi:hypothetical protein